MIGGVLSTRDRITDGRTCLRGKCIRVSLAILRCIIRLEVSSLLLHLHLMLRTRCEIGCESLIDEWFDQCPESPFKVLIMGLVQNALGQVDWAHLTRAFVES